jgi:hypothetical protein
MEYLDLDSTITKPEQLRDRTLRNGLCVKNSIRFVLNKEIDLDQIEIGGYKLNDNKNVSINILTGEENRSLKYAGSVPNMYNEEPVLVELIKRRTMVIELKSNEPFRLSYFNIIK